MTKGIGGGAKRTPTQREHDLTEIARRYLQGETQAAIGQGLSVTQQQVSHDLAILRRRWQQSALVDINEARGRELAKIDALEREYWTAWQGSRKEKTTTATRKRGDSAEASLKREQRDGNPAFLDGVMKCIERRCHIIGIDAPESVNVDLFERRYIGIDISLV